MLHVGNREIAIGWLHSMALLTAKKLKIRMEDALLLRLSLSIPECAVGLVVGREHQNLETWSKSEGIVRVFLRKEKDETRLVIEATSEPHANEVADMVMKKVKRMKKREEQIQRATCFKTVQLPSHTVGYVIQKDGAGLRYLNSSPGVCFCELKNDGCLNVQELTIWATSEEDLDRAVAWVCKQADLGDVRLQNRTRKIHSNRPWKPGAYAWPVEKVHKLPQRTMSASGKIEKKKKDREQAKNFE